MSAATIIIIIIAAHSVKFMEMPPTIVCREKYTNKCKKHFEGVGLAEPAQTKEGRKQDGLVLVINFYG